MSSKMLDLIRQSAVPANVMRTAAKGGLSLPAVEMVEILVLLSEHPIFGDEARITLAGWEHKSALEIVSNPASPTAILSYFADPDHLRPDLFPALMDNPSVPENALSLMALKALRSTVEALLKHPRTHNSPKILHALSRNENLRISEIEGLEAEIAKLADEAEHQDASTEAALELFTKNHADELAKEGEKPFEFFRYSDEEIRADILEGQIPASNVSVRQESSGGPATAAAKPAAAATPERVTPLQKIARMSVGERVQLAMKGSKDERFILIRDGSKVVSAAVLESPKLTDTEVETFSAMKNVQESVLRTIAGKRKFMKLYPVIRSLINNPRTPIDVSLPLLNHLLVMDLRALSSNKNVGDLLRKMAHKLFRERTETKKQH